MRAAVLLLSLTFGACSGSRQPPPEPVGVASSELPDASSGAEPAPVAESEDGGEQMAILGTIRFGDGGGALGLSGDASGPIGQITGDVSGLSGRLGGTPTPSATVVSGQYDTSVLRRHMQRELPRVRRCYERALANHPQLETRLVVEFVIDKAGNVTSAGAPVRSNDSYLDACVLAVIMKMQFPAPHSGSVRVRYPFRFRPAE